MADITYTVIQDSPETIQGFEQYSEKDLGLVESFQINNIFDPSKHQAELHVLTLSDELLESNYDYRAYKLLANAQSAGKEGASVLTLDPVQDVKDLGYESGDVKLLYHFLNDLYSDGRIPTQFYIEDISPDRTELRLNTLSLTPEQILTFTNTLKSKIEGQSYFGGFRLNFKNNDLLIAVNVDTLQDNLEQVVLVKLYEPLPSDYGVKDTLTIVEEISDSVTFTVDYAITIEEEKAPTLRGANFNIEVQDEAVVPTGYYNYNELFSYPVTNINSQVFSVVNEKSIDVSVDYSDFSNFVHFSSAQERLLNFKYKLDLVNHYRAEITKITSATTGLTGVTGSRTYYENLIQGVVNNFDHYERYLYYETGDLCWPKYNTVKPYDNMPSNDPIAITWYTGKLREAAAYDDSNFNALTNTIPTYLREDDTNQNYLTFVYMIGQHFDNLWLYSKAVTDKYDADNRLNKGISKDLVAEALKNFGVKLYTSNKSTEELFSMFVGQGYQAGDEVINNHISATLVGTIDPIEHSSFDNYQKEIQKRMYHNLPLLLKSKGTERGLRALINCFGIPSDILSINTFGGINMDKLPFYGDYEPVSTSLNKVRLDNTGSIVTGDTLSTDVSIIKREKKYTDDLHQIEVGFSPTTNVDNHIRTQLGPNFNIDEYLGNPSNQYLDNYDGLGKLLVNISQQLEKYDLQDYVRLIKFFDNVIFKTVKDFIPARVNADTGIIIKPNLLTRNKAKGVELEGTRPEYSGSIDTAFITGSHGGSFRSGSQEYSTVWTDVVQTPFGTGSRDSHQHEEPKYNGEFSGSLVVVSDGEWNRDNIFKVQTPIPVVKSVVLTTTPDPNICPLRDESIGNIIITSYTTARDIKGDLLIAGLGDGNTVVYTSSSNMPVGNLLAYTFPSTNYAKYSITGSRSTIEGCASSASYETAYCEITNNSGIPTELDNNTEVNLTTWFTAGVNTNVSYTASWGSTVQGITTPSAYTFTQGSSEDTVVTITLKDNVVANCNDSVDVTVKYIAPPETLDITLGSQTCSTPSGGNSSITKRWSVQITGNPPEGYTVSAAAVGTITGTVTISSGILNGNRYVQAIFGNTTAETTLRLSLLSASGQVLVSDDTIINGASYSGYPTCPT